MKNSIDRHMVMDACIEALRSGAAHKFCAIKGEYKGEEFKSRFEWSDWLKDNKEDILKSVDGDES